MGHSSNMDNRAHRDMVRGDLAIFSQFEGPKPQQTAKFQVPEKVALPDLHLTVTLHVTVHIAVEFNYSLQQVRARFSFLSIINLVTWIFTTGLFAFPQYSEAFLGIAVTFCLHCSSFHLRLHAHELEIHRVQSPSRILKPQIQVS